MGKIRKDKILALTIALFSFEREVDIVRVEGGEVAEDRLIVSVHLAGV